MLTKRRCLLVLLAVLGACDAETPQRVDTPNRTDTANTQHAQSARRGGTRVTVDRRFAHVMIVQPDERGRVVTRCVTQLEHPLDALEVPPRHAEVQ